MYLEENMEGRSVFHSIILLHSSASAMLLDLCVNNEEEEE
jgi:hypothetical protein